MLAMRYLAGMPELQTLEILVPRDYLDEGRMLLGGSGCSTPHCDLNKLVDALSVQNACHIVEAHCSMSEYWRELASLQQRPDCRRLQISLILEGGPPQEWHAANIHGHPVEWSLEFGRRCLGIYAHANGYRLGYVKWLHPRHLDIRWE